jgi:hypothetical protein
MAEFDVPKSNPQAIIRFPFIRKGELIYCDTSDIASLFLFAYANPR